MTFAHIVTITPTESDVSWHTAEAECSAQGCGYFVSGRASTVIALAHDHATDYATLEV